MVDTTVRSPHEVTDASGKRRMQPWPLDGRSAGIFITAYVVLLGIVTGLGFLITGPLASGTVGDVDLDIARWFASARTGELNDLTDLGSAFSDTATIVILLLVAVPLLIAVTRRWKDALLLVGAVSLETLTFVTAAFLVGRDRPPVEQLDTSPPTASFPSGHTGAAVAFYVGLVVLVFWWTENRLARAVAVVAGGTIPVLVALSRMYRGMHFLTDVAVGGALGLASLAVVASILTRTTRDENNRSQAV